MNHLLGLRVLNTAVGREAKSAILYNVEEKDLEALLNEPDPELHAGKWREIFIDPSSAYDLPLEFVSLDNLTHLLNTTEKKFGGFGIVMHPRTSFCTDPVCRGQSPTQVTALQERGTEYAYPFIVEGEALLDVTENILEEVRKLLVALMKGLRPEKKTLHLRWEDLGISPRYDTKKQSITVEGVASGSVAEDTGIQAGMVIRSLNTKRIGGPIALEFFVEENPNDNTPEGEMEPHPRMIFETPTEYPNSVGLCEDAFVLRVRDIIKVALEALIDIATPIGPVPEIAKIEESEEDDTAPKPVLDTVSYIQMKALGFHTIEEFQNMRFEKAYSKDLPFTIYRGEIGNRVAFANGSPLPVRIDTGTPLHLFGGYPNFEDPDSKEHLTPLQVQQAMFPELCSDRNVVLSRVLTLPCGDQATYTLTGVLDEYSNSFASRGTVVEDGKHLLEAGVVLYSAEPFTAIGEEHGTTRNPPQEGFLPQGWEKLTTVVSLRVHRAELLVNKVSRNMYWYVEGYHILGCGDPFHEIENMKHGRYRQHAVPIIAYLPDTGKEPQEDMIISVRAVPLVELSHPRQL